MKNKWLENLQNEFHQKTVGAFQEKMNEMYEKIGVESPNENLNSSNEDTEENIDKISINLNNNPNYKYVPISLAEEDLGKKFIYSPEVGADNSWVECYGAARYEIKINGYEPGTLHGITSKKFDEMNNDQQWEVLKKVDVCLLKGIPILVAVNVWENNIEDTRKNNGGTKADHFVVIVGHGRDNSTKRFFYLFNENAGSNGQALGENMKINRLYRYSDDEGNLSLETNKLKKQGTTWIRNTRGTGKIFIRRYNVTDIIFPVI